MKFAVITIYEYANDNCPAGVESTLDYTINVFDTLKEAEEFAKKKWRSSTGPIVRSVLVVPAFLVLDVRMDWSELEV